MKKILIVAAMFIGMCMTSCHCFGTQDCSAADSTSVDTTAVDSIEAVDSVAADSTVCPD